MTNRPKKLIFATNNAHKLAEMRQIVGDQFDVLSLDDINCHEEIPENELTLEGNALAKARWIYSRYGIDCFADDTGLEVTALSGAPGVLSARYAGPGHDSKANMLLLLENMQGITDRSARFRTVIALIMEGKEYSFQGMVDGTIALQPSGHDGFGYDPIFVPQGDTRSFAQYTTAEKNAISHRGRATAALLQFLKTNDQTK